MANSEGTDSEIEGCFLFFMVGSMLVGFFTKCAGGW